MMSVIIKNGYIVPVEKSTEVFNLLFQLLIKKPEKHNRLGKLQ